MRERGERERGEKGEGEKGKGEGEKVPEQPNDLLGDGDAAD